MSADPEKRITELEILLGKLNQLSSGLRCECEDIAENWQALGKLGGQRADHAAILLGRLRPHLADLASFAKRCESQIDAMIADPFCRGAAAPAREA